MQSMINVIQYLEFLSLATQDEWTWLLIRTWFTVTGPKQVIVSVQHPTVAAEPTEDEVEEVAADEVPATKVSDDEDESDDDSSEGDK